MSVLADFAMPKPDTLVDNLSPEPIIYIVHNDSHVSSSISGTLNGIGLDIRRYRDARTFLENYDRGYPSCVILDVDLTGMNMHGFVVGGFGDSISRRANPTQIVFWSSQGDVPTLVKAMLGITVPILEAPDGYRNLVEVVQRALSNAVNAFHHQREIQSVVSQVSSLTSRERDVLRMAIEGLPSKSIARALGTSVKTIDVHRYHIKCKSPSGNIASLIRDVLRYDVEV